MKHTGFAACAFVLGGGLLLSSDLNAGSLEPPGAPAPTMKTIQESEPRTPITSVPITIATPGSYYLTADLTGVSGQNGITITTSFVTLDFNGFSLIGVSNSGAGVSATAAGLKQIAIRNGVIRNWSSGGIYAGGVTEAHIDDLRIENNGVYGVVVGARGIVRGTTAAGNQIGIAVDIGGTVVDCMAANNTMTGFQIGWQGRVSNSSAVGNPSSGFVLNLGSAATDCTANANGWGFNLAAASRVARSLAMQNGIGFFGGDGVSIEECTANANTDEGIRITRRGLVRGNVLLGNTNNGIHTTGDQNRIEGNESTANGTGIRVDSINSLIVKNSVGGNTTEYSIAPGNKLGPISPDPATAGPWANFDL